MNIYKKVIFTFFAAFMLTNLGCSSSGDSTPSTFNWAAGVYTGTFTETGSSTPSDVVLLVTSDNRFALATLDGTEYNIGSVSGSSLSTTDGFVATLTAALSGTYSAPPSFTGTFTLTDTGLYNRTSSTAKLEGTWVDTTIPPATGTPTFVIDAAGDFTLSTTTGCAGSGSFSTIDPSKNEYEFSMLVTNCPGFDGNFTGLAITDDQIDIIAENPAAPAFIVWAPVKQ
jgi:hypothetical protein